MDLQGKKLLVIGGAGLIGSHTVDELLKEDVAEIRVFDNFSRGREQNLSDALTDSRVQVFPLGGDILHTDILNAAMQGMDGVFHFAALWLLHCQDYPRSAFEVNVGGTFNVLEACVKNSIQRLVYSSSASVYGDAVVEPMTEDHPFGNRNFYGATKICGEAMTRAMHQRYSLPYVGLRYMNVYGPRADDKGAYVAVIMKMIEALELGDEICIQGDGSDAFDFVNVVDCAQANVAAMRSDAADRFYNVGTGVSTTVRDLALTLMELTGIDRPIRYGPPRDESFVRNRVADVSRAKADLDFVARIDLRNGLASLIQSRVGLVSANGKDKAPRSFLKLAKHG